MTTRLCLLALLTLTGLHVHAAGGPTVAELMDTCSRALAGGYRGIHAGMCDWYVTPCEVCSVTTPPDWCAPPGVSRADLARVAVEVLEGAAPDAPARAALVESFAARYPCARP